MRQCHYKIVFYNLIIVSLIVSVYFLKNAVNDNYSQVGKASVLIGEETGKEVAIRKN